jgi:uncharacterized protein (DUF433 family)
MNVETNPLARGFYTVNDAARLIEAGRARRIMGWFRGYPRSQVGPLLVRDFQPIGGHEELSFLDLMEVRFVETFREAGVGVRALRQALVTARDVFKDEKPLVSARIRFVMTKDRKNLFSEEVLKPVAKATHDTRLWSLLTRQYEMYTFIMDRLERGVTFDPQTDLANQWTPRPDRFPDIIIDPRIAYGQPALPNGFPTQTIYESWRAEDEDYGSVSDWFDIPLTDVQSAVAFEQYLNSQAATATREPN